MSTSRFWYLVGAMMDCLHPDATDPVEEVATRKMREKVLAVKNQGPRGR